MSDFSFKVLKCQIQKFPIWHVIFVMLSWHILCFCKTFMMSKCPHTVIWRHVKCIYKGIIDLRFEFVWPEIFHLSGKYFEKQLIGMCQMPHISPLIAMIESLKKKWTWNFFMSKLSALSPRYEKNLQKKYYFDTAKSVKSQ